MEAGPLRASDLDRERVAELLRDAYATGRLSRAEFDERSSAAYTARIDGELRELTVDFPAPPAARLSCDAVTRQSTARTVSRRAFVLMALMCLLVLAAGLAGRVFPAAVWVTAAAAMVPFLLAVGTAGQPRVGRSERR